MRFIVAIIGLIGCLPVHAVEAPKIAEGDALLVYARIIGMECSSQLQAIEVGWVDDDGLVTLF